MNKKIRVSYLIIISAMVIIAISCKKNTPVPSLVNVTFTSYSPPDYFPEQIIFSGGDTAVFSNPILKLSISAPHTPYTVSLPIGKRWVNISGNVLTSAGTFPFNFSQSINVTGYKDTILIGNIASDFRYKKNITSTVAKNFMPQFMQVQENSYQYKVDDFS